jgi:cytochrome c-type biogenesis protein CcmH/NrfG
MKLPHLLLASLLAAGFSNLHADGYSAAGAGAYVQSRDYQGLLSYAQAWTQADPNDADAWAYLGATYGIYLNQPANAIEPMKRSLALNPNQAPGWHALGVTYIQTQKYSDAVTAIKKAIQLNPNQPTYWNNLAVAYSEQNDAKDAESALASEAKLATQLNNAQLWYTIGNGYAKLIDLREAGQAYTRCVTINPQFGACWTNLGAILQWMGNTPAAFDAYNRGAQLGDPLAAQDSTKLQQALQAQAAEARAKPGISAVALIIEQQGKANMELQLHNSGDLNINDHLP